MSHFEYKLQQLTNFLGKKKLKQLGLLTCDTCNLITSQSYNLASDTHFSDSEYLTIEEIQGINEMFFNTTLLQSPYLDSNQESTTDSNIIENSPINDFTPISNNILSVYEESPQPIEDLIKELLLKLTATNPTANTNLGIGYIYNLYPPAPPHALTCTECNRLYAIAQPTLQLVPLPVILTPTEYEILKGVYVDIML